MATLICELNGVRGRKIKIYDNKCEITTDVTFGSVITHNATDGRKTIFYKDVIGLQFKETGMLSGYLQFETSSGIQNNTADNFFNENTFTFQEVNGVTNKLMEEIYYYIGNLVESYKYNDVELRKSKLPPLLAEIYGNDQIITSQMRIEQEKIKQERIAKEQQENERIKNQIKESVKERLLNEDSQDAINSLLEQALQVAKFVELKKIWDQCDLTSLDEFSEMNKELENLAYIERMYGTKETVVGFISKWKDYLSKLQISDS